MRASINIRHTSQLLGLLDIWIGLNLPAPDAYFIMYGKIALEEAWAIPENFKALKLE